MSPVWTPLNSPPGRDKVCALSANGVIVLQALREAHRKKQERLALGLRQTRARVPPDPRTYYKALYQESFKQENQDATMSSGEQKTELRSKSEQGCGENDKEQRRGAERLTKCSSASLVRDHIDIHHDTFVSRSSQDRVRCSEVSKPYIDLNSNLVKTYETCEQERATSWRSRVKMRVQGYHPGYNSIRRQILEDLPVPSTSDSPPIETEYYQEFSNTPTCVVASVPECGFYNMPVLASEHKSTDTSVEKLTENDTLVLRQFLDPVVGFSNAGSNLSIDVSIDVSKRSAVETGMEVDSSGDASRLASSPKGLGSSRYYAEQEIRATMPDVSVTDQEHIGTGIIKERRMRKPEGHNVKEGSQNNPKIKKEHPASCLKSARQNEHFSFPLGKRKGATSKNQPCKRKTTQPTRDQIFGNSDDTVGVRNVATLTAAEREVTGKILNGVNEVVVCLVYQDGSSQLREPEEIKGRSNLSSDEEAKCLVLAFSDPATAGKDANHSGGPESDGCGIFISIPLANRQEADVKQWSRDTLLALMGNDSIRKICFDAQELIHMLICRFHLDLTRVSSKWSVMDPKVAAWLLDADHPPITFSDLCTKYLPDHSEHRVRSSTCSDLTQLGIIMKRLFYSLSDAGLWQLFFNVEMKLCPILAAMEVQGIQVDPRILEEYGKLLQARSQQVEQEAHKVVGHPFQIASHVQLRHILFEELQLDKKYQGKKLARTNILNLKSTSETVLLKLQEFHPLPQLVLKYRQLAKLKSTYIDGILDSMDKGCIHTSWEQTSSASGRLQSANPNIQNIPKKPVMLDEVQEDVNQVTPGHVTIIARKPFVSRNGWSLLAADFQSIELRLLAHLSHDPALVKAFIKQDCPDIFVELTSQWLGIPTTAVTTSEREKTKRIVYSVIYGVGPDKLAETLHVGREEAKIFTKSFLKISQRLCDCLSGRFQGVSSFTKNCISCCQRHGFVQTILKRRRLIPNINSSDFHVRSHAERQCVNFVVQGSAADICKMAMIRVVHALADQPQLEARLLVQIHDELLLEVADENLDEVKGIVRTVMTVADFHCGPHVTLQVPLPVSISVGKHWGQLQ